MIRASDVLDFWFSDRVRALWFASTPEIDAEIRDRFAKRVDEAAANSKLDIWLDNPSGALALVIMTDQFPRHIYRDTAGAFARDIAARSLADRAIRRGHDRVVAIERRQFFYLPFMHSEALADQERSLELYARWVADHPPAERETAERSLRFARRHHEIVEQFGRFPRRNAALGRESTPDEIAFLAEPGSAGAA